MAARVFVSHASADITLAREVHRWLVEAGHDVFLDQDLRDGIAVGEQWEQRLYERLRWADAVVCVVTSGYLASRWCMDEVAIARSRGSRMLPLRAEPGIADPLLKDVQYTDMAQDPVAVRAGLIEGVHRVDAAGGLGWPDDRSPFPGLRPFDVDQHQVFFARTNEVKQLAELLRSPAENAKGAVLLVVGPSGCGKSSLVRAGLLPVMAEEVGWWVVPPIVPGVDPLAALVRELAAEARRLSLGWTVAQVRHQVDNGGLTGLAEELLLNAPRSPRRLLVVMDQFEELLTQTAPTDRARFTELLGPTLIGPVQLVGTLRPEFLDQLLLDPDLAALSTHTYTVRPLHREALRLVIEGPARLASINVDEHLVARLIDDTDSGEALPLLVFTLAQLADGISRGGQLSTVRYEQLGGVQGALIRAADAALAAAITSGRRDRKQVIDGLLRLVTVDEKDRPTPWRILRNELSDQVNTELDAFVARRLLITDNGNAVIGVAHEAFLSAWPPLAEAIAENVSALRARRSVEHAAAEWNKKGRPPVRLWGSGQLAAVVADTGARIRPDTTPPSRQGPSRWLPPRHRVLVTDRVDLTPKARDFLWASIRRDRSRRRRATAVLSVLLILALAGAGFAFVKQRDAQEQQRIATAGQLVARAEAARRTDLRAALRLGLAAQRIHPDGETHSSLLNTLTAGPYAAALIGHRASVNSVAFAPGGRTVATGSSDRTVILWDLTDPARPRRLGPPLTGHRKSVNSVVFAPDGRTLATGSTDTVQPRSLGSPLTRNVGLPLISNLGVSSVAFSPDGRILATGSYDSSVILFDLTDPARPHSLGSPLFSDLSVLSTAFSPDGHTLATGGGIGTLILWDPTHLSHVRDHVVERACAATRGGFDRTDWARYIPNLPYQDTCSA